MGDNMKNSSKNIKQHDPRSLRLIKTKTITLNTAWKQTSSQGQPYRRGIMWSKHLTSANFSNAIVMVSEEYYRAAHG